MPKRKIHRNARIAALHKTAAGLASIGAIDKATMRDFDAYCLTKTEPMAGKDQGAV